MSKDYTYQYTYEEPETHVTRMKHVAKRSSTYVGDRLREIVRFVLDNRLARIIVVSLFILSIVYYYMGSNILAFVFSIIAILCFIPMRVFPLLGMEFGFAAMILLSSLQGFQVGFIVGKVPNLIGHIVTFQLDLDLIYEFFIYIPIALFAAFVPFSAIVPFGIMITVLYNLGYIGYFKYAGLLTFRETSYAVTNCIFNCIIIWNLAPLLQAWGFA